MRDDKKIHPQIGLKVKGCLTKSVYKVIGIQDTQVELEVLEGEPFPKGHRMYMSKDLFCTRIDNLTGSKSGYEVVESISNNSREDWV